MEKITVTLVKTANEKDINIEAFAPINAINLVVKAIQISDDIEPGEYLIITHTLKVSINAHLVRRIRVGYFDEKTKIWKNKTPGKKFADFLRGEGVE